MPSLVISLAPLLCGNAAASAPVTCCQLGSPFASPTVPRQTPLGLLRPQPLMMKLQSWAQAGPFTIALTTLPAHPSPHPSSD